MSERSWATFGLALQAKDYVAQCLEAWARAEA